MEQVQNMWKSNYDICCYVSFNVCYKKFEQGKMIKMKKFDRCLIIEITKNQECVLLMYVINSEINLSY